MITKSIDINKFTRMRYFDGLFLQQDEFRTDQDFYLTVRRYLNYLLFNPGVLFTTDPGADITTSSSLRVTAGTGLAINVAPGVGLVSDPAGIAYEVEVPTAQTFDAADIATAGLDGAGSVIKVILHRDDNDFILNASAADRTVERAQISLVAPGDLTATGAFASIPHIELATLSVNAAGTGLDLDNDDRSRGGIKLSILSQSVYSMLGSGSTPAPSLTGFNGVDQTVTPPPVNHVIITGTNFAAMPGITTVSVEFSDGAGGYTAAITVPAANVTPGQIRIDWLGLPTGHPHVPILASARRGPVRVTVPGHSAIDSTGIFDFFPPPITDPLPATHSILSGALTITGERLYISSGFPQVEFVPVSGTSSTTGVEAGSSDTSILVIPPSTAGSYAVRVSTEGGTIEAGSIIFIS